MTCFTLGPSFFDTMFNRLRADGAGTHAHTHRYHEFMNTSLGVGYIKEMACGKCGQTPDVAVQRATCCSSAAVAVAASASAFA